MERFLGKSHVFSFTDFTKCGFHVVFLKRSFLSSFWAEWSVGLPEPLQRQLFNVWLLKYEIWFLVDFFHFYCFPSSFSSLTSLKRDTDQAGKYELTIKQYSNYLPFSKGSFWQVSTRFKMLDYWAFFLFSPFFSALSFLEVRLNADIFLCLTSKTIKEMYKLQLHLH